MHTSWHWWYPVQFIVVCCGVLTLDHFASNTHGRRTRQDISSLYHLPCANTQPGWIESVVPSSVRTLRREVCGRLSVHFSSKLPFGRTVGSFLLWSDDRPQNSIRLAGSCCCCLAATRCGSCSKAHFHFQGQEIFSCSLSLSTHKGKFKFHFALYSVTYKLLLLFFVDDTKIWDS